MRSNLWITVLFTLLITRVHGQGLVFNDDAYKKIPSTSYGDNGAKGDDPLLKNVFKVDLKPLCPEVKHQGNISSCVGWAVGYGAMTIEKAVVNNFNDKNITNNLLNVNSSYIQTPYVKEYAMPQDSWPNSIMVDKKGMVWTVGTKSNTLISFDPKQESGKTNP